MAVKKTARKAARKAAKPVARAKAPAKDKLECQVCGYRVIVDQACGCVEEHVLICCGQPMMKKSASAA